MHSNVFFRFFEFPLSREEEIIVLINLLFYRCLDISCALRFYSLCFSFMRWEDDVGRMAIRFHMCFACDELTDLPPPPPPHLHYHPSNTNKHAALLHLLADSRGRLFIYSSQRSDMLAEVDVMLMRPCRAHARNTLFYSYAA